LGHKECQDLKSVIEYIYEHKRVSSVALWGRSMGAVSALFYMAQNPGTVNCAVLDSGYAQLDTVVSSLGAKMGIPPEFIQMLLPSID